MQRPKVDVKCLPWLPHSFFIEAESLAKPEVAFVASLATKLESRDTWSVPLHYWNHRQLPCLPGSYMASGCLDSGLPAFAESTLFTKLSPQSIVWLFCCSCCYFVCICILIWGVLMCLCLCVYMEAKGRWHWESSFIPWTCSCVMHPLPPPSASRLEASKPQQWSSFVHLPFLLLGPQGCTDHLACFVVAGIRTLVLWLAWQVFLTSEPLSYLSSPFDHYFYNMFNLFFTISYIYTVYLNTNAPLTSSGSS